MTVINVAKHFATVIIVGKQFATVITFGTQIATVINVANVFFFLLVNSSVSLTNMFL